MSDISNNSSKSTKPTRQSNFELLRIIAMFMIIAHHFSLHGGFNFSPNTVTLNQFWISFFQLGGKIGVNIFVLLSGYFLINATELKISKVLKLWMQIFFYSAAIWAVFVAFGLDSFSVKGLIKAFFPITFSQWWFASAYFVLFLFSPFISRFLNSLDQKAYQKLILLMSVCWSVVPTFLNRSYESNSLIWFTYLFALAGYIRLWGGKSGFEAKIKEKLKPLHWLLLAAGMIFLIFLSSVCFDLLGTKISFFAGYSTYFHAAQKLPALLTALFMFIGFKNLKIGLSKFINIIASSVFGIYLIHDSNQMRDFLWGTLFKNSSFQDSSLLILYSIAASLLVFAVCSLIELARIYLLERLYMPVLEKVKKTK